MPSHAPYLTVEHQWLTQAINRLTGFTVDVDPHLDHTCVLDLDAAKILVRPGLSFPGYHRVLSRATLRSQFPHLYLRDFHPEAPPVGGIVLPFPRGSQGRRQLLN